MTLAWTVVIAGLVAAPLVTWFPMLAHRFPGLGLPEYPPAIGVDLWQLQAFWIIALAVIALIVGERDRYLGVMVAIVGFVLFLRGAMMDPTHSVLFALGALLLCAVRQMPKAWVGKTKAVLIGLGAFQVAYLIQQYLGYDLLWGSLFGGKLAAHLQPLGTLGGVDASASYVAILSPLMPVWLLPFAALVVWSSHSLGAVAAMLVGLAWQYRPAARSAHRVAESVVLACAAGLILYGAALYLHKETQTARVNMWKFASHHWVQSAGVPLGWGLGGWSQFVPALQDKANYKPHGELWREAHNEPLQWLVETGLVGILILGLWLYDHRRMFVHPVWGGSLAALASDTLTWHPFHIVSLALVGLVLVGLATRQEEAPCIA